MDHATALRLSGIPNVCSPSTPGPSETTVRSNRHSRKVSARLCERAGRAIGRRARWPGKHQRAQRRNVRSREGVSMFVIRAWEWRGSASEGDELEINQQTGILSLSHVDGYSFGFPRLPASMASRKSEPTTDSPPTPGTAFGDTSRMRDRGRAVAHFLGMSWGFPQHVDPRRWPHSKYTAYSHQIHASRSVGAGRTRPSQDGCDQQFIPFRTVRRHLKGPYFWLSGRVAI